MVWWRKTLYDRTSEPREGDPTSSEKEGRGTLFTRTTRLSSIIINIIIADMLARGYTETEKASRGRAKCNQARNHSRTKSN